MRLLTLARRTSPLLLLAGVAFASGCYRPDPRFHKDRDATTNDDTGDITDDTDTPDDTGDSDTDTGTSISTGFDDPGDAVLIEEGAESVDLTDESGDSNKDQTFYLIAVNGGDDDAGFRLKYDGVQVEDTGDTGGAGGAPDPARAPTRSSVSAESRRTTWTAADEVPPPMTYTVGQSIQEFRVRNDFSDDGGYETITATLWGLGDGVAIWVDDDQALDHDTDCDGLLEFSDPRGSNGFDNCDLQTVADIVDGNIIVNLNDILGETSDINGDGRISVVITPVLNTVPQTSSDEEDWTQIVGSYADPDVDLNDFDDDSNPGSDQQEVIYVFAPDPYGEYNPYFPTTVDEYTSMSLAAEIARSFTKLILYNHRVILQEEAADTATGQAASSGTVEESWLVETIGAAAADYVGFGAVYHDDAWHYLDAPYLYSLSDYSDDSLVTTDPKGAQYLFGVWLVDTFGTSILTEIVQLEEPSEVATENVMTAVKAAIDAYEAPADTGAVDTGAAEAGATGLWSDANLGFSTLVAYWHVGLLASGVETDAGDPLVSPDAYPQYADIDFRSGPTTAPATPTAGVFYGANGYQFGFDPRGSNFWLEGGTTASPAVVDSRSVNTDGTDFQTYVPGFEFYGAAAAGHGVFVSRLTGLEYDRAEVEIQTDGTFSGIAVRWKDQVNPYMVENIYSPLSARDVPLPVPAAMGDLVQGYGDVSSSIRTQVLDPSDDYAEVDGGQDVADLDRWLLDLSSYSGDMTLHVWLDRRFENAQGDAAPYDPWIAVVPSDWMPTPDPAVLTSSTCSTSPATWAFPNKVLSYVADQYFLSESAWGEKLNACPEPDGEVYTCASDFDLDGVSDADEPSPGGFNEQVWLIQCDLGYEFEDFLDESWFDVDEFDDDLDPTRDTKRVTGGRSGPEGEEAWLEITLTGGQSYVVVVSGGGDTGAYELNVKWVN